MLGGSTWPFVEILPFVQEVQFARGLWTPSLKDVTISANLYEGQPVFGTVHAGGPIDPQPEQVDCICALVRGSPS